MGEPERAKEWKRGRRAVKYESQQLIATNATQPMATGTSARIVNHPLYRSPSMPPHTEYSESNPKSGIVGVLDSARRVKGKRTRTGCLTCRARKVKCDENPGTCENCERVLLACRWPAVRNVLDERTTMSLPPAVSTEENGRQQISPSSGPIRRNRQAACVACRIARCRCSQGRPSCTRCIEHGQRCEYGSEKLAPLVSIDVTPSSDETSPNDYPLLKEEAKPARGHPSSLHGIQRPVIDRHIDAFFNFVYPCQANAVIHRGTLLRDIQAMRASKKVLLSICAVASRFIEQHESTAPAPLQGSGNAQAWAREAKTLLILDDEMSLDNVACALILAKHDINSGRYGHAFVLASIANRTALALGLHKELPPDHRASWTERETRRRLMWACYCLDRMMSTGVQEFILTQASNIRIRLPCDDHQYLFGIRTETPMPELEQESPLDDPIATCYDNVGMFGHYVRIMGIRTMILRSTRSRDPTGLPPWDPSSASASCARKIAAWQRSLSPQFQLIPETIYARQFQNQLTPLVMLHVWYDQCLTDLYRLALPGFPESADPILVAAAPAGWIEQTRFACVEHAKSLARTLRTISSLVDPESFAFLDASLPICVYESMRVRLQYLFMIPLEEQHIVLEETKADLECMVAYVEKMTRHFRQAEWLLKEMRRMLRRHGIVVPGAEGSVSETSGHQTPHDPWTRRVRGMREYDPDPDRLPRSLPQDPSNNFTLNTMPNVILPAVSPRSGVLLPNFADESLGYPDPSPSFLAAWSLAPSNDVTQSQQNNDHQDDMAALLGQYEQSNNGMSDISNFLGMFADWVATGYDGTGVPSAPTATDDTPGTDRGYNPPPGV